MTKKLLPKLNINNWARIAAMPVIDRYDAPEMIDGTKLHVSVYQDGKGQKYFMLGTWLQVYGWTTDPYLMAQATGNMCVFTSDELYQGLRGHAV